MFTICMKFVVTHTWLSKHFSCCLRDENSAEGGSLPLSLVDDYTVESSCKSATVSCPSALAAGGACDWISIWMFLSTRHKEAGSFLADLKAELHLRSFEHRRDLWTLHDIGIAGACEDSMTLQFFHVIRLWIKWSSRQVFDGGWFLNTLSTLMCGFTLSLVALQSDLVDQETRVPGRP